MIFFHWYLGDKLRLLHYVRNDGLLLNLKGRVIASRAKQSSFKTIVFAGQQAFFTKKVALYST
jgi:hypothetical protein